MKGVAASCLVWSWKLQGLCEHEDKTDSKQTFMGTQEVINLFRRADKSK